MPRTGRPHATPSTTTGNVSPAATPARAAVGADITTPPRTVRNPDTSMPEAPPATYGRKGASEKGSMPRTLRACPGNRGEDAKPSTTGAEARRPRSVRIRARRRSSTEPVGLETWCVARPDTVSAEMRKAARELWIARSIARTTATPSATPRTDRTSCIR